MKLNLKKTNSYNNDNNDNNTAFKQIIKTENQNIFGLGTEMPDLADYPQTPASFVEIKTAIASLW